MQSSFQVESLRENPFDFILPPPCLLKLPLEMADPLRRALGPYISADAGETGAFARRIADEAGGQAMPFLALLADRLFADQAEGRVGGRRR